MSAENKHDVETLPLQKARLAATLHIFTKQSMLFYLSPGLMHYNLSYNLDWLTSSSSQVLPETSVGLSSYLYASLLMYGPVCPGTCLMLSINSVRLNYNLYLSCHYPILTLCVISSWYSSLFYNSWYFHFTFMLYQTSLLFSPFIFWAPLSLLSTVSLLGGSKFISYCGLIHLFYISVYLELLVKKTCSLTKFYYNSPL